MLALRVCFGYSKGRKNGGRAWRDRVCLTENRKCMSMEKEKAFTEENPVKVSRPPEIPASVMEHTARMIDGEKYRTAAVCIPLLEKEDGFHVLFEVRSGKIGSQPGDVCFPGGMCEEGESPVDAAVRETVEELLVEPSDLVFVAPSDYILAASRLSIYPFVFRLNGYRGSFSTDEVAEIFTVPLADILAQKPEAHLVDTLIAPREDFPFERVIGGRQYKWRVRTEKEVFYRFGERTIWGLTARLLHAFAKTWGVTYRKTEESDDLSAN